jgi:glycosyltransferase involved in cell wall biosynthesis
MPVYESEPRFFTSAIESLLDQSFNDFEIVLSDNGSRAAGAALYREYAEKDGRIRYIRHSENQGQIANFNLVVREARGEYFMWAADDDLRDPDYLRETAEILDRDRDCIAASSGARFIDEQGTTQESARFDPVANDASPSRRVRAIVTGQSYLDTYALYRRASLLRSGLARACIAPDYVLVSKLLVLGRFRRVDRELFSYRRRAAHTLEHYVASLSVGSDETIRVRGWHREVAVAMLAGIWDLDLPIPVKLRCQASLAVALGLGSFIIDSVVDARQRCALALQEHKYGLAALQGLRYLALSPRSILHGNAWDKVGRLMGRTPRQR